VASIDMLFLICNNSTGNDDNLLLPKYNFWKLIKLPISSHSFAYKWMDEPSVSAGNDVN
jgi:hypothetical protein